VARWLDRLLSRDKPYAPTPIAESSHLEVGDRVEFSGQIDALSTLIDPVDGRPAVAMQYRAKAPAALQRFYGIKAYGNAIDAHQATNFVLRDASGSALVEVEPGGNLGELHHQLQRKYGVELEAEVEVIAPGERVRVQGRIVKVTQTGSPHRRDPWSAVVAAEAILLA